MSPRISITRITFILLAFSCYISYSAPIKRSIFGHFSASKRSRSEHAISGDSMEIDPHFANPLHTYATLKVVFVDYKVFYTLDSAKKNASLSTINPSSPTEQVFLKLKINEGIRLEVNRAEILKPGNALNIEPPYPVERLLSGMMIGGRDSPAEYKTEIMQAHHLVYLASDGTFRWIEINHTGVYELPPSSLLMYVIYAGAMDYSIFEWLAEYNINGNSERNPSNVDAIIEITH